MQRDIPLVSVIIPAYNAETFIERTLNSVLSQTYTNMEVLVVDDGSRDRTGQILKSIAERDGRVLLLEQQNAGVAAARNLAIEKSTGDYVAPIDADDIWFPQKLHKQVQCMLSAGPSVGLVYAWQVRIDEDDTMLGPIDRQSHEDFYSVEGHVLPALVYSNFLGSASTPLIRRSSLQRVGGYNTRLKAFNAQGCEDWDIYLRIAEHYEFRVVREFLIGYRQVRSGMSRNVNPMAKSYNMVMANVRPKHPEIPIDVYTLSASNFSFYMSGLSAERGDYAGALRFSLKGMKSDYSKVFAEPPTIPYLIKLLVKLALSPILRRMDLDPPSWFHEAKIKLFRSRQDAASSYGTHFSDIQALLQKTRLDPIKRYGRIKWRRWLRILQMCQQ